MIPTLPRFFERSVDRYRDNIYLWEKTGERFEGTSYSETRVLVHRFAAGLMSLGIQKKDRVALLSEGRNFWVIGELGILYTGAMNVPLSVKLNEPGELRFRLSHSGCRMILVSGQQAGKIRAIRSLLPELQKVILLDDIPVENPDELTFKEVLAAGDAFLQSNLTGFTEKWQSVEPDDPANICYTSGTTADPKGIVLTHRNYVSNVEQGYSLVEITSEKRTLLILPWDHAFAHTAGIYCFMGLGASIGSVQTGGSAMEGLRNISRNIRELKPAVLLSVPSLAGNFRKNIERSIHEKGKIAEAFFHHALRISYRYNGNGWRKGKGMSWLYRPLISLYDLLFFRKIREGFGGKLEYFVGGGALLDIEFQEFFYALGIPMLQGYGLTEAAPIISANSLKMHKLGSSGMPVRNMELRICDEKGITLPAGQKGEIQVKGDNVMKGYWRNEEATASTIIDGWLHTGDLGYIDEDGFLYVLGRFKSLLISDDGEKYSPEGMEETFVSHSGFIDQCMLYNNQDPYTVVLVVPNREAIKKYLAEQGIDPHDETAGIAVLKKIADEFNAYRPGGKYHRLFPQRWLPSAIAVLDESFTEENQLMNSTLKIVRGKIIDRYKDRIRYLYTAEARNIINERNLRSVRSILEN